MRKVLIIILISVIMGISVAFGINKLDSRHIEQNLSSYSPPPEINLTDKLLTKIYNRLLNIEKELIVIRKKGDN